jgi:hypothetical protein
MQVPRFSPRISLIEMAPRPAPRSGCPTLFVTTDRQTPQGTGSDWKNLPGTAHTDRQTLLLYLKHCLYQLS